MRRGLKTAAQAAVHLALAPLERHLLARHGTAARGPAVFIVGAPRSGTSLFYELLVTRYRFAYFSNLAHRFYRTPVAVSLLGRGAIRRHRGSFESDYGHISGWSAPNEGGWIWQRWLADGDWQDETARAALAPGAVAQMQRTVAALSAVLDAPFVNKNVMHSNRMRLLDVLFPGCLFLEVRRDPADIARSIIRAQERNRGHRPSGTWWSVKPSAVRGEGPADLVDRACLQVRGVAEDIARDAEALGPGRLHVVDYAALCAAPGPELARAAEFLARGGLRLAEAGTVPAVFPEPARRPLAPEIEDRIGHLLAPGPGRSLV